MKYNFNKSPREFKVGKNQEITLQDMGVIYLDPNEQITFMTNGGAEFDFCCKEWGYYATPSMNDRLKRFGFKTGLVQNSKGQLYIMAVFINKLDEFSKYLLRENNRLIKWLDEEPLINA